MFSVGTGPVRKNPLDGVFVAPKRKNPLEGVFSGAEKTNIARKNPLEGISTRTRKANPLEGIFSKGPKEKISEAQVEKVEEAKTAQPKVGAEKTAQPTHKISSIEAMKYLMKVVVTKDNVKRLALGLTIGTILTVTTAGLGGLALPAASGLASNAAWSFGSYLATSAGTKLTSALAARNFAALKKKLPPSLVTRWSEKLGLPLTKDTTYQDLLEITINSGSSLARGGPLSFLISSGLSVTVGAGAKFVKAGGLKAFRDLPGKVIERLSNPGTNKVDLLDLAQEIADEAEAELEETKIPPKPTKPPTVDQATVDVLGKNKVMAITAGISTALVGLAISGVTGGLDVSLLTALGSQTINIAKENTAASGIIANVVASTGVSKVVSILGLSDTSSEKLEKLVTKYRLQPSPNVALKILTTLTKGQIYGVDGLSSKNKAELIKIAKDRGIKVPARGVDPKSLRKAILDAEARALADTQMLVQTALTTAVTSMVGSAIAQQGLDSLTKVDPSIGVVDPVGNKINIDPYDETMVSADLEFLKLSYEADARVAAAAAKMAEAQAVKTAAAEAAKAAGLAERAAARAELKIADQAARAAAIEAAKAAAVERLKNRPLPPAPTYGPEIPNEVKLGMIRARRELQEAAKIFQQTGDLGFIVVPTEGPAIGVPAEDVLLDPRIQEALNQFGEITPLASLLAAKSAAYATSWGENLIPGWGVVTQSVNNWDGVAETAKNAYKLTQVIQAVRGREGPGLEVPEGLDQLLSQRIPNLASAVEAYIKQPGVDLKRVLLNALKDQVVHPDRERLYSDIGRQILWGERATEGSGLSEWMVREIGSTFYHSIMG